MDIIESNQEGDLDFIISFYDNGDMLYSEYDKVKNELKESKSITIETGKLLKEKFDSIKVKSKQEYFFKNLIPRNVFYFKEDNIIWTTEAGQRDMIFENDIVNGLYPVPDLIWNLKGKSLNIFALDSQPKTNDFKLYQAPFLNINSMGSVCIGSVKFKFKSKDYEHIMKVVENAFYNSYFTHTNENLLINGNINHFYKEYLNKKKFPTKLLLEVDKNLLKP